jgi:hypothetical protein
MICRREVVSQSTRRPIEGTTTELRGRTNECNALGGRFSARGARTRSASRMPSSPSTLSNVSLHRAQSSFPFLSAGGAAAPPAHGVCALTSASRASSDFACADCRAPCTRSTASAPPSPATPAPEMRRLASPSALATTRRRAPAPWRRREEEGAAVAAPGATRRVAATRGRGHGIRSDDGGSAAEITARGFLLRRRQGRRQRRARHASARLRSLPDDACECSVARACRFWPRAGVGARDDGGVSRRIPTFGRRR